MAMGTLRGAALRFFCYVTFSRVSRIMNLFPGTLWLWVAGWVGVGTAFHGLQHKSVAWSPSSFEAARSHTPAPRDLGWASEKYRGASGLRFLFFPYPLGSVLTTGRRGGA